VAVPLLTALLLNLGSRPPYLGPATAWQLLVLGLFNGLMCPACFRLFDRLRRAFEYQPLGPGSFRPDREIKRGRH
jgi:hypothetical protein